MPRDPLGPRNLAGPGANALLGLVLLVLGLVLAFEYHGWTWLVPLIGATLIAVCGAELYLDPVGGPRRGIRGALREHRRRRAPRPQDE